MIRKKKTPTRLKLAMDLHELLDKKVNMELIQSVLKDNDGDSQKTLSVLRASLEQSDSSCEQESPELNFLLATFASLMEVEDILAIWERIKESGLLFVSPDEALEQATDAIFEHWNQLYLVETVDSTSTQEAAMQVLVELFRPQPSHMDRIYSILEACHFDVDEATKVIQEQYGGGQFDDTLYPTLGSMRSWTPPGPAAPAAPAAVSYSAVIKREQQRSGKNPSAMPPAASAPTAKPNPTRPTFIVVDYDYKMRERQVMRQNSAKWRQKAEDEYFSMIQKFRDANHSYRVNNRFVDPAILDVARNHQSQMHHYNRMAALCILKHNNPSLEIMLEDDRFVISAKAGVSSPEQIDLHGISVSEAKLLFHAFVDYTDHARLNIPSVNLIVGSGHHNESHRAILGQKLLEYLYRLKYRCVLNPPVLMVRLL